MGGRGSSWQNFAKEETITGGKLPDKAPGVRELTARYQTLEGNHVSSEATLARTEAMITENNYETGLIIDQDGFVLGAVRGGAHSVNMALVSDQASGNILTHNHPSNSAAFSIADISTAGIMGVDTIRATTKSSGTVSLSVASNHPNWSGMASAYGSFISQGRTVSAAQKWLSNNASKYGLKYSFER